MATEDQGHSESAGTSSGLELADHIRRRAAHNARASLADDRQLRLFLDSWWSKTYNRPLKDPLLQSYTLEELLYEFYDRLERNLAEEEHQHKQEVQEETDKEKDVLDWIEEEERKEAAKTPAERPEEKVPTSDPTKDPENIKWMEEQMRLAKSHLGDDFGEDLELNFDDK